MIYRVTEKRTFRRCKRQWDYASSNRQNLEKIIQRPALALGTLLHESIAYWAAHPTKKLASIFGAIAVEQHKDIQCAYRTANGFDLDEGLLAEHDETVQLGIEMAQNYQEHYGTPLPPGFTVLVAESKLIVPVPGTPHYVEGTLDFIVRHDPTGSLYVLDHKSFDKHPSEQQLADDDQFLNYIGMLSLAYPREKVKLGVLYDGLWKRTRWTKDKKPKERPFSELFMRREIYRTRHEIEEWLENLRLEVEDMSDPNLRIYPSRHWTCVTDCTYQDLCRAQSRGEDINYIKRTLYRERFRKDEPMPVA